MKNPKIQLYTRYTPFWKKTANFMMNAQRNDVLNSSPPLYTQNYTPTIPNVVI